MVEIKKQCSIENPGKDRVLKVWVILKSEYSNPKTGGLIKCLFKKVNPQVTSSITIKLLSFLHVGISRPFYSLIFKEVSARI